GSGSVLVSLHDALPILSERRDPAYQQVFDRIAFRHRAAVDSLLGAEQGRRTRAIVDDRLGELRDALHGIRLLGHCPSAALDVARSEEHTSELQSPYDLV